MTYIRPRPKVNVKATFLHLAICRFHTIGIGKTIMHKSTMTLTKLAETTPWRSGAHVPGSIGFRVLARGRQLRKTERMTPTAKDDTKTMIL